MIHGHISSVGVLANTLLNGAQGKVAYAFISTLYLQTEENDLFCLTASKHPRGPLNLQTSVAQFQSVAAGTVWRLRDRQIKIGRLFSFELAGSRMWAPCVPAYNTKTVAQKLPLLKQTINETQPSTSGNLTNAISAQLTLGITALEQWLTNTEQRIPEAARKLIGCGDGLTPAGDDYLSGVLITLHYLQHLQARSSLQRWVNDLASSRTSDISRSHLAAAGEGNAVEPVHELLSELFSPVGDDARLTQLTHEVSNIGHSSGCYILKGISAAFERVKLRPITA